MKVLLLVSILLVCTVSAGHLFEIDVGGLTEHSQKAARDLDFCPVATCANKGDMCNITNTRCLGGDIYCNITRNICDEAPALKKFGESCTRNSECEDYCINNVCNSNYSPGTPCSSNYQCAYSVGSGPYITVCNENKKCAGVQEGGQCSSSEECFPPLSCNFDTTKCVQPGGEGAECSNHDDCVQTTYCDSRDNKCKLFKKMGDACDLDEKECADTSSCTPTDANLNSATCKDYFSQALNAPCSDAVHCMEKLYCNLTSHTCQKEFTFKDSSRKICDDDSDCAYYEECACDGKGENRCFVSMDYVGVSSDYANKWEKLNACTRKCLRTDNNCLAKCEGQQCSFYGYVLGFTADQALDRGFPKCYVDDVEKDNMARISMHGYYTCDASTIFASLLLAIASAFVLLVQ